MHFYFYVRIFCYKMFLYHLGEHQNSFSSEPDWIQQPVIDYMQTTDFEETTVTRY